eukprot:3545062-Prymnesium_polylepis.2
MHMPAFEITSSSPQAGSCRTLWPVCTCTLGPTNECPIFHRLLNPNPAPGLLSVNAAVLVP